MRLTLRTLLAYMDDILDPTDQEDLGRKIEASPFATELIHRSRDAVRRLRLSAPEPLAGESGDLHGGDFNLDANTAAEYLDNTLSPEQVADFERQCLEAGPNADMLLAEAASCHHILTLVLGEPAEVDGDLRQRLYELAKKIPPQQLRVEPAHAGHKTPQLEPAEPRVVPSAVTPSTLAPTGGIGRPQVDPDEAAVPDYMLEAARARRRSRNQMIAMMFAAAAVGAVAAFILWPQDEPKLPDQVASGTMGDVDKIAAGGLEIGDPAATDGATPATGDASDGASDGGAAPPFVADATGDTTDADATPSAPADGDAATGPETPLESTTSADPTNELGPTLPPADQLGTDLGLPPTTEADAAEGPEPPIDGATTPTSDGATTPAPGDVTGEAPATPDAGDAAAVAGNVPPPAPANPDATPPDAAAPPDETPTDAASADAAAGDAAPADAAQPDPGDLAAAAAADFGADQEATTEPAPDETPRTLGSYLGLNNDLLLRYDKGDGAWVRLPPRSTLTAGDRLLVLPAFRTLAVLGADVNAFIAGGTELTVTAPRDVSAADIGLELPYGRVILNAGLKGNRIALTMGDQTRVINLGPSSSLAVEVTRTFVPGRDPKVDPAPLAVSWYLTTGNAEWNDGTADRTAEGPATWATVDGLDQEAQAIDELPNWIDKEPITNIEAGARDALTETLVAGESVATPLSELTSSPTGLGRRTEVRSLAARSGAYVGQFEALIKALSDPAERARRKEQIETLRAAIARNPEAVEQIHATFLLQRGEDAADDLTQMLLGYSAADVGTTRDEVKNGILVRLINWLNDDDLAYRVLASHNINEITGTNYLGGYRPEHAAAARQREMRYYWDRLERGELMPK